MGEIKKRFDDPKIDDNEFHNGVHKGKENPFEGATRIKIPEMDRLELLRRLFDPNEPWVIVPNGSMFGFFDFVPKDLRVGPWKPIMPFYIGVLVSFIAYYKPESLSDDMEITYPQPHSKWWWYNVIAGLWMTGTLIYDLKIRSWTLIMYTVQSWIYLTLRHSITAIAPFLQNQDHFLLHLNEFLRFPSLVTATVTFTIWNFIIAPAIWLHLKTPEQKKSFKEFNFSYRLIQMHILNIVFATLNNISVSPRRSFVFDDLWCALALAVAYNLFYFFILDRLGIHLYPNFSPRSKYMPVFAVLTWVVYYGAFLAWNKAIESGIFAIEES